MIATGRRLTVLALTLLVGLAPLSARADDDAGTFTQLRQCVSAAGMSFSAVKACESAAVQSLKNSIPDNAIPRGKICSALRIRMTWVIPMFPPRPLVPTTTETETGSAFTPAFLFVRVERGRQRREVLDVRHGGAHHARVGVDRERFVAEIVAHARHPRVAQVRR